MQRTNNDALRDEAYRRYQNGDPAGAERLCRELLRNSPPPAEAVYLLGVIAQDFSHIEQARELFQQSTRLAPDNAVFINTLGEIELLRGRQTEALACFRKAIALRPSYERAHNNLGRVLHAQQNFSAAQASFEEAVRLNPRYAIAHNNLGAVFQAQGQFDAAGASFRRALAQNPDYPEAHFNLGTVLQSLGDPVAATAEFQTAIRLRPNYARAHFHLGQVLEQQRREPEALVCYQTAAGLNPDDSEMQRRMGDLLLLRGDWPAGLAALERAVAIKPDDPESFARLAYGRQLACDWRTYAADAERLWADAEKQIALGKSAAVVPFQALTLPWTRSRLLAVARSHCDAIVHHQHERGQKPIVHHPKSKTGRLRIGYFSGDYYDHPISHLIHGLFSRHDRERFEVFAYSFGPPDNSVFRKRIESDCEHFVDVAGLSTPALAQRIAADGIDILLDLMGHTGINRLSTLAMRPAPIQVSFLGMLGTIGANFIDYMIGDRFVTPPEFAADFIEKFVTLPHSYLIAEPEPIVLDAPVNRAAHGLPETGFVYCSFSSTYKIEPHLFDVWMRILSQVPSSVLWLYSTGATLENNLRREAESRGVAPQRLVFASFKPRSEHLLRHQAADLFLDTHLYNGAATASLALQAGLPVLTCPGDTFASRVGASLLNAVGLPELIASDVTHYEQLAIHLGTHTNEMRTLREKLLAQRSTAPLFDTRRFVRNLERAYQSMWDIYAAGRRPEAITVNES